jgi:uncharacterized protein
MATVDVNRELSDQDHDALAGMLSRVVGGEIPNLETLDGFLTALVICPEPILPSEFVPVILSGQTEDGDLVFESTHEAEEFYGLLVRYWNQINRTLREGDVYMPVLFADEEGIAHGNDWAKGFLKGTHLRHDTWREIINDENRSGPLVPIWALAYEHAEDPYLRPYKETMSVERREQLLAAMIAGAKNLYDMFRKEGANRKATHLPSLASFPKVGRNEPCPCGSGKKFKKCCGQTTFH